MHALRTLRAHGMADVLLHCVTEATLVSQLTCAFPAWSGFVSETSSTISFCNFGELSAGAGENLFFAVRYNPQHVLHKLLPSVKISGHNLRQRSHNFTIPGNIKSLPLAVKNL